jgi:long-chain fatty acid transport protein
MSRSTPRTLATLVAAAALAGGAVAHAGGFARPNPISARSMGTGGAFVAVADDPTALHFNPAGMARLFRSQVMVGGELIVAPRTYIPVDADGNRGEPQQNEAPPRPLPSLGFATRFSDDGVPTRLAFGVGLWVPYGGQLDYPVDEDAVEAVFATRNAVFEVTPGLAYEVSEQLAIGFAARLGIGLFDVDAVRSGTRSEVHTRGLGVGFTLGAMLSPSDRLSIGAVYRSPITIDNKGTATLQLPQGPTEADAIVQQRWPQSAAVGVAYQAMESLLLVFDVDWTGWSRWDAVTIELVGQSDQPTALDFNDNYTVHAGAAYTLGDRGAVRVGASYDSPAVPDHTIQRQFLDSHKIVLAAGGSVHFTPSWRLDAAVQALPGLTAARQVENNTEEASMAGWPGRANVAPGEHFGKVYGLQLALQYLY